MTSQSASTLNFDLICRSEEWREDVLNDVNELDWSYLDVDAGYALLRWWVEPEGLMNDPDEKIFRIYTDIVDLQQQDSLSMSLLRAAHKFKLSGLMGE